MWADGQPVGVIDFDTASPGPRVHDLAYLAYRFAPLTDPANPDVPPSSATEQLHRLAVLLAAYGTDLAPRLVLEHAADRLDGLSRFMVEEAEAGNEGQRRALERGDGEIYARDAAWVRGLTPLT